MKKNRIQSLLILLALLTVVQRVAGQGTAFSYQGQLQDNGQGANGLYDFEFQLASASGDSLQLGCTVTNLAVGVTNGLFATTLDFGAVFTGNPAWLAISVRSNGVGAYTALQPLQALTPVPYAIFANTASNLSGSLPVTQLSGVLDNSQLSNSAVTINTGSGLAGGGVVVLGGSTTLSNTGLISMSGNGDITASTDNGAVTLGDTATSTNVVGTMVKRDADGNFSAGTITANLEGNAATATTATNFAGKLSDAQLSANVPLLNGTNAFTGTNNFAGVAILTNGNNILSGAISGNAGGLTNLNASQLSSGTLPLAQLPAEVLTNWQSGVVLNGLTTVSNLAGSGTNFANYFVVSNAPSMNGNAITNLNAGNLSSGTVPLARLSGITGTQLEAAAWQLATNINGGKAALASNVVNGLNLTNAFLTNALITNSTFAGDGSGLTNLNASQLSGGILPLAQLPGAVLTNLQSGVVFKGLTTVSNLAVSATNFVNYLVVSNPPVLSGSAITGLNAGNLSGGTVPLAQLNGITSNQLDQVTWQLATNLNGGNAALASNVVSGLSLTNAFLTNAVITNSMFAGDGSALTNLNASQLSSGTVPMAELPGGLLTNNQGGVVLNGVTTVSNLVVNGTNFVNYLVVSNAPSLNGGAITGLNASSLSSGTVPLALLNGITGNQLDAVTWQLATNLNGGNAALASNVVSGLGLTNAFLTNAIITNSMFAGDGSALTNLNASQLSSGTVPMAELPGGLLTNNQGGVVLNGVTTVSNLVVNGTNFVNYLVVSNAPSLNGGAITGLNASSLSSGTVPLALLNGITGNQLDAATWQLATNLNGGNAALASNVVSGLGLTNAFLTNAIITNSMFAGDGSALTNLNAAQLSSGTVPLSLLNGITSNQLDAATWQLATNLNGGNAALASNVVSGLGLTNAFLTNAVIANSFLTGDGSGLTNLNAAGLVGVLAGNLPMSNRYGLTNVFDGDSYTTGNGSLPYTMPLGVQQMSGIPSVSLAVSGTLTLQILQIFQANPWAWSQPNIIWAGNNDITYTSPDNVVSNIGVMVADMALSNNTRYLVLGIIPDYTNEGVGTEFYQITTNLNAMLQATFTNHYVDVLGWMVQNYNPNSLADQYGLTNDCPPASEWNIPIDHPNVLGESLIANKVLESASWLNNSAPVTTASVQEQLQNTLSQPVIFGNTVGIGTITNQPLVGLEVQANSGPGGIEVDGGTFSQSAAVTVNRTSIYGSAEMIFETGGAPDWLLGEPDAETGLYTGNFFLYNPVSQMIPLAATSNGFVAVGGSLTPMARLYVGGDFNDDGTGGIMLDADPQAPDTWSLRINPFFIASGQVGYQFATRSAIGGLNVPLAFDANGNDYFGKSITISNTLTSGGSGQFWVGPTGIILDTNSAQIAGVVMTNSALTANISSSTNGGGFAPLFSASGAPNDGSGLIGLNASQLTGTVPSAQLPLATTSALGLVQPDGTSITVNHGVISVGVGSTIYITNGMSDGTALSFTNAHGLGTFPGFIHPILLCTTNDAGTGMVAGQMTEFTSVSSPFLPVFASVSFDALNIYINTTARSAGAGGYWVFPNGSAPTSWNNFAIVVGFHQ